MAQAHVPDTAAGHGLVTWASLPPDLVLSVASAAKDHYAIVSMQGTSKRWHTALADDSFWRQLVKERFGSETEEVPGYGRRVAVSPGPWQLSYWRLLAATHVNAASDATTTSVAWGDKQGYYSRVSVPGAHSPRALCLQHVCWLSVASHFRGVCPGRYKLVWRLRLAGHVPDIDVLLLDACVMAARDVDGNHVDVAGYPATSMHLRATYHKLRAVPADGLGALSLEEELAPAESVLTVPELAVAEQGAAGQSDAAEAVSTRPLSAFHALQPADSTFFKVALHRSELQQLAWQSSQPKQSKGNWWHVEVGLDVPHQLGSGAVAEYDIVARLWNTSDWWKSGLLFDTISLSHVGAVEPSLVQAGAGMAAQAARAARAARAGYRAEHAATSVTPASSSSPLQRVLGWLGLR